MSAYVAGHLLGRAVFGFLLVWLVCWLTSRLDVRRATQRSLRWYSLLAMVLLVVLGMGVHFSKTVGAS